VFESVEVGLQLGNCRVDLFAERDPVELIERCRVKALDDSVGLRAILRPAWLRLLPIEYLAIRKGASRDCDSCDT
jgi:hypothetical protein